MSDVLYAQMLTPTPSPSPSSLPTQGYDASSNNTRSELDVVGLAAQIKSNGYAVMPSIPFAELAKLQASFRQYLDNIPEMKDSKAAEGDKGIGSFGAINFASAFHHPHRLLCDLCIQQQIAGVLAQLSSELGLEYVQQIPDRSVYRTQSQKAESWHTDNTAGAKPCDVFLSAHLNLNSPDSEDGGRQTFTCAPGHHSLSPRLKGGDYTPSDEREIAAYKMCVQKVSFWPGQILVHFENIPHLAGCKVKEPVMKKIGAFRLSNHDEYWMPENRAKS